MEYGQQKQAEQRAFRRAENMADKMVDSMTASPISYRLNVFRSCVREATNRIDALRSGLEI